MTRCGQRKAWNGLRFHNRPVLTPIMVWLEMKVIICALAKYRYDCSMRSLVLSWFLLWPCAAWTQEVARLPTKSAAAAAFVAYEANICRALIDVCEGIAPVAPDAIDRLTCRKERKATASCSFTLAGRKCRARFIRSDAAPDGWAVAFRNRVPKGSDVQCRFR